MKSLNIAVGVCIISDKILIAWNHFLKLPIITFIMMFQRSLFILIVLILTSCVSEKELLLKCNRTSTNCEQISGTYSGINNLDSTGKALSNQLYEYDRITLFERDHLGWDSLPVTLHYDGNKKLSVLIGDSLQPTKEFSLKVKNRGNYLSVKQKLLFTPIPFLLFIYKNRKALIYTQENGNLAIINGRKEVFWIFIAAGNKSFKSSGFVKQTP